MKKITVLELETPEERKAMANYQRSRFCGCCINRKKLSGFCNLLESQVLPNCVCDFWEAM